MRASASPTDDPAAVRAAERWLAGTTDGSRILADSDRRQLVRLPDADGRSLLLKRFRPRRRRIASRVQEWLGRSPADREWRSLRRLADHGVAVPRALARGETRGESWLVLEYREGRPLESMRDAPRAERRAILEALGRVVAELHDAGVAHGDLHVGNVIVADSGPVVLDFQRARRTTRRGARWQDLGALDFSLRHHGFAITDRVAVRLAAIEAIGATGATGASPNSSRREDRSRIGPVDQIGRASLRHARAYYASRSRRSRRPGRRFAAIRRDGERGLRAVELGEEALVTCLEAQSEFVTGGSTEAARAPTEILKRDHRSVIVGVDLGERRVVVKEVVKRGLARRLADFFRGSPARRAWTAGHRLEIRGIRVARPLAFVERRRLGFPIRSRVVLEDLRPALAASDAGLWRRDAENTQLAIGRLVRDLHRQGVEHGDLQALHVYLEPLDPDTLQQGARSAGLRAALIDLEGVRFHRRLSDRLRLQALAELNASLPAAFLSAQDRRRWFERYARALPFRVEGGRVLDRLVGLSLERRHLWSGEDCDSDVGANAPPGITGSR